MGHLEGAVVARNVFSVVNILLDPQPCVRRPLPCTTNTIFEISAPKYILRRGGHGGGGGGEGKTVLGRHLDSHCGAQQTETYRERERERGREE